MATLKQIEALTNGRLDVGFVRLPVKHPLLAVRKVITERLTIATSDKFNGPMTMKGIKDQSFILIDRGVSATYHDHCISLCDRSGFTPRIVYEPNDMFTILNLVSAGIGVSLVPRAARAMQVNGVKFAPVLSSFAEWDIGMAWNRQLESEIIRKFAGACRPGQSQTVSAPNLQLAGQIGNPRCVRAGTHIMSADNVRSFHDQDGFRGQRARQPFRNFRVAPLACHRSADERFS
jgi:DNA-binding transcriptional LysR family regulator